MSPIAAAIQATAALSEAIRDLGEVPAGHLYARVMHLMPLDVFDRIIGIIVASGVAERRGDLLVWKGGAR